MTATSYITQSGRVAVRAPCTPSDRARLASPPLERRVLGVLRQGRMLSVRLECGHEIEIAGPTRPATAACGRCRKEQRQ